MKTKERKILLRNTLENFNKDELVALLAIGIELAPNTSGNDSLSENIKSAFNKRLCESNSINTIEDAELIQFVEKYEQLSEIDIDLLISSSIIYWVHGNEFLNLTRKVFNEIINRVTNEVVTQLT